MEHWHVLLHPRAGFLCMIWSVVAWQGAVVASSGFLSGSGFCVLGCPAWEGREEGKPGHFSSALRHALGQVLLVVRKNIRATPARRVRYSCGVDEVRPPPTAPEKLDTVYLKHVDQVKKTKHSWSSSVRRSCQWLAMDDEGIGDIFW